MSRLLTDEERHKLVSTIHSMVYWVGVLVPEYEMLESHKVELRETVYRLVTKEHLTEEDKAKMEALIASLKKKEHDLEHKLSHDPMTVQAGKALMEEISGLLEGRGGAPIGGVRGRRRHRQARDHVEDRGRSAMAPVHQGHQTAQVSQF